MNLSDFDFQLPEELIATRPVNPRSAAHLLVAKGDNFDDGFVSDLPGFLKSGDRLVFNDTKVLPARMQQWQSCRRQRNFYFHEKCFLRTDPKL